jgi:hypothetical protein
MIMALKDAVRRTRPAVPSRAAISDRTAQIRTAWTEVERKYRAELSLLRQIELVAKCGQKTCGD